MISPEPVAAGPIGEVTRLFGHLRYMHESQALILREIIAGNDLRDALELGTCHGKGTAYLAAIMEELGRGRVVTLDRSSSLKQDPNLRTILRAVGLSHRVMARVHPRSATMTLMQMLEEEAEPCFDFAYFDAGYTWDTTGFLFLLVDLLLKPGAWVVMHDLDRAPAAPSPWGPKSGAWDADADADERGMRQFRKTFEILPRRRGYRNIEERELDFVVEGRPRTVRWGIAQKA